MIDIQCPLRLALLVEDDLVLPRLLAQAALGTTWRVKTDDDWLYLYILIEFQSQVDPFMAVRLLVYVGLLYQDLIRRKEIKPGRPLPPVLPIVLSNGGKTWTAPADLAALLPQVPGLVADYLPRLKYLLIVENRYGAEELKMTLAEKFDQWAEEYKR